MAFMSSTNSDHFGLFESGADHTAFDMAVPVDDAFLCDLAGDDEEDTKDLSFTPASASDSDSCEAAATYTDEFFCDLTEDDFLSDANLSDTMDASTTPPPQPFAPAPLCSAPACPVQQIHINFTFPWVRHMEGAAAPSIAIASDHSPVTSSGATTPCLSDSTGSLNIPEDLFNSLSGPDSPPSAAAFGEQPEHLFNFGDGMLLPEVPNAAQPAAQANPAARHKPQAIAMPHPCANGSDACSYDDEVMSGMPAMAAPRPAPTSALTYDEFK